MKCLLCNKEFKQITGKHLLLSHGIKTVEEYKKQFPDAETYVPQVYTDERREIQRKNRIGYKHSQKTKDKIGKGNLGKIMPREAIERQRQSLKKFYEENGSPLTGISRTEEVKKKLSRAAKNRDPELVCQKVEMMWAARRGSKATPEQRERYSQARIKFMTENPDKLGKVLFNTKPELEFEEKLKELQLPYKKNIGLPKYLYDFVIDNNIIIEIDGPYHWNKNMYGSKTDSDLIKLEGLNKAIEKDKKKNDYAISKGYKIYRIKVESKLPDNWVDQLRSQGCSLF